MRQAVENTAGYEKFNVNSSTMKGLFRSDIYFVSIIANLVLSAAKLRKRFAAADLGAA